MNIEIEISNCFQLDKISHTLFLGSDLDLDVNENGDITFEDKTCSIEAALNHEQIHIALEPIVEIQIFSYLNSIPALDHLWFFYDKYVRKSKKIRKFLSGLVETGLGFP